MMSPAFMLGRVVRIQAFERVFPELRLVHDVAVFPRE